MTREMAILRNSIARGLSFVSALLFACMEIGITTKLHGVEEFKWNYYLATIYFAILAVVYLLAVISLNNKMKQMVGNYDDDII